jgi:hypothetical protein
MRPALAIAELENLKQEASDPLSIRRDPKFGSWKARVRTVFVKALGFENDLVKKFDAVHYSLTIVLGPTPQSEWDAAFVGGVNTATGLIDAAIYELGLMGGDEPIDEHAFDAELWAHVKQQVEDDEWGKVASLTAIFVENHVRTWAGDPKDSKGNALVGKQLYLEVFADASPYRLGRQPGEFEGWRFLGMGFAQALSNVDRHRIQKRDDAKRYALGVLGLGSLLLTQLRYEHGDLLKSGS